MMELPSEMRSRIVEEIDVYVEAQDEIDGAAVAAFVTKTIGGVGEALGLGDRLDIVLRLESSGEMEASLQEILEEEFASREDYEFSGEEIVAFVEKACDVVWTGE